MFDYILDYDFDILTYTRIHLHKRVPSYLTDSSTIGIQTSILNRFDKLFDQLGCVIGE